MKLKVQFQLNEKGEKVIVGYTVLPIKSAHLKDLKEDEILIDGSNVPAHFYQHGSEYIIQDGNLFWCSDHYGQSH